MLYLRFNPCQVYLLPFLPQTGLLALGCSSVLPIGFGRSMPVLLSGNKNAAEHKATPVLPPPHPCTEQSNICTTIHNQETKPSRSTINTGSFLAVDPFEAYTQPHSWGSCLPFSSLSQGLFLSLPHTDPRTCCFCF